MRLATLFAALLLSLGCGTPDQPANEKLMQSMNQAFSMGYQQGEKDALTTWHWNRQTLNQPWPQHDQWRCTHGFLIDKTGEVFAETEGYPDNPNDTRDKHARWFIQYLKPNPQRIDLIKCQVNDEADSEQEAEQKAENCLLQQTTAKETLPKP